MKYSRDIWAAAFFSGNVANQCRGSSITLRRVLFGRRIQPAPSHGQAYSCCSTPGASTPELRVSYIASLLVIKLLNSHGDSDFIIKLNDSKSMY